MAGSREICYEIPYPSPLYIVFITKTIA